MSFPKHKGVILYILLAGFPPFYGDTEAAMLAQSVEGDFEFVSPQFDDVSNEAKDLIVRMLTVDPLARLDVHGAQSHTFFSVSWKLLRN